ncbi:MAG: type II toxin-antitoxin system Phd/YefM family antitoxin [Spirochaetales bacterium]
MKTANVSTTKNKLSSILSEVKRGETYLIVDRDTPI